MIEEDDMRNRLPNSNLPRPIDDKQTRRAARKNSISVSNCVSFIKGYSHNTSTDNLLISARKEVFRTQVEAMKNRQLPCYLIEISPTPRQFDILDGAFKGPKLIQKMLDSSLEKQPDTNELLLSNKDKFYNELGADKWSLYVGFLRSFINLYKESDMVYLELPVGDSCSLSASNKVYISSLNIGLVAAKTERTVLMLRQWKQVEGFRYLPNFSVIYFDGRYYAKIKYQEDDYFRRKNKDLLMELEGTLDVLIGKKLKSEYAESKSFSRVEISDSSEHQIYGSPVNHAHNRDPRKKWS
ncbi:hypothetical protein EYY86_13825 [Hafnia paralvei]|uniref:hypothetical protein n=1 Tax=Hafnia paralvei TaxID=546367 RepID=UPI0010338104|nr:hypothetical protein [Hafnia paralvei]TBM13363.1 hypothetical protein EYY86_13825 [Hafnia paralvei]